MALDTDAGIGDGPPFEPVSDLTEPPFEPLVGSGVPLPPPLCDELSDVFIDVVLIGLIPNELKAFGAKVTLACPFCDVIDGKLI